MCTNGAWSRQGQQQVHVLIFPSHDQGSLDHIRLACSWP
jgi:hypothetical protein